jgi:hypothetical protein
MKSVGALMAGMHKQIISYSYDAQGRMTEPHTSGAALSNQVTGMTYNEHGDKTSERQTTVIRSDNGPWQLTDTGAFIATGQ